jgi:hypothetical protein
MRQVRTIYVMLVLLALASGAQAQIGNWGAVRNLAPGSSVSVKARHHLRCIFEDATDDALVCKRIPHGLVPINPAEITFDRRSIREVRLERSSNANAATGAAIGVGVGAAVGATNGNGTLTREGSALLMGGIGGIVGHFVGKEFPILPGQIIYQR